MGAGQSLASFIFPKLDDSDLAKLVHSIGDFVFERVLGKGRVSWSLLVRQSSSGKLSFLRLYAKSNDSFKGSSTPLASAKLNLIHELYFEKCTKVDFVIKPTLLTDIEGFIVMIRPFSRYNLPDRMLMNALSFDDKLVIGFQLLKAFQRLHAQRIFHGDFSSGRVLLTSQMKVLITDFAPIKPFCRTDPTQSPFEFYQIWFDEGLDGGNGWDAGCGCYLAPERLKLNSDEALWSSDLFSLGCVIAEIFSTDGSAFLQFKDVLLLSKVEHEEEYNSTFNWFLERAKVKDRFAKVITSLCCMRPDHRQIRSEDIEFIISCLSKHELFRQCELFQAFKCTKNYELRKSILLELLSHRNLSSNDFELVFISLIQEQDPILKVLLKEIFFANFTERRDINVNWLPYITKEEFNLDSHISAAMKKCFMERDSGSELIESTKSFLSGRNGGRDFFLQHVYREQDLFQVLKIMGHFEFPQDKRADALISLLQIYRSREILDKEFEEQLSFEIVRNVDSKDDVELLFKSYQLDGAFTISKIKKFSSNCKVNYDDLPRFNPARFVYQLDFKRNNVHTDFMSLSQNIADNRKLFRALEVGVIRASSFESKPGGRLKQRLLTTLDVHDQIVNLTQSPDDEVLVTYSENELTFWDVSGILSLRMTEPLAIVKPRLESVIRCVSFISSTLIAVSFKDGIIGIYRIDVKKLAEAAEESGFTIKNSFGPFDIDSEQLLIGTCRNAALFLMIEGDRVLGIDSEFGDIVLDWKTAEKIAECRQLCGCLLVLDVLGCVQLVDLQFCSGQVLNSWSLSCDSGCLEITGFEVKSIEKTDKFLAIFKGFLAKAGDFISVFEVNPSIPSAGSVLFTHWTIGAGIDDKSLPKIKLGMPHSCNSAKLQKSSLAVFDGDICEISAGVLRLVDWIGLSANNASSILLPEDYKPSLKLRAKVPEIIEKKLENFKSGFPRNFLKLLKLNGGGGRPSSFLIAIEANKLSIFG